MRCMDIIQVLQERSTGDVDLYGVEVYGTRVRLRDQAWPGCAVATVSPVTALCVTSMKPCCLGLDMALRLER